MKRLLSIVVPWLGILLLVLAGLAPAAVRSAGLQVTSPADSGSGTLREALLAAAPGDTITFSPAVFPPGSPVTIFPQSVLPTLNQDTVTLDASSTGVILDGSHAPAGTNGLIIEADNCTIRGLTIRDFGSNGIFVSSTASGTTIGGDRGVGSGPNGQGNLIVLNGGSGLEIRGEGSRVQGNYIGVDGSGTWDWGNAFNGVALWLGASGNTIGGTTSGWRNVIGGNDQNGVWIGGDGSDSNVVIGNYLGARADGLGPVPNSLSGIAIQSGAQNNRVGGTLNGEGNLISGNAADGVFVGDPGTTGTLILGNIIGPHRLGTGVIGQGLDGVVIALGAQNTVIGSAAGPNLIGGNTFNGIRIEGSDTTNTVVQGNILGANLSGTAALPNGMHGVELTNGTHGNQIGGNRLTGEGNLLSGNANHGLLITNNAHHNTVAGNLIGPDASASYFLGNHPWGGIDISNGAHHNTIGGLGPGEGNVVSGNPTDGIALFKSEDDDVSDNQILGNLIGLTPTGAPLPNHGWGILNASGVVRTLVQGNTIAFNEGDGILIADCTGNSATQNSIHSNGGIGIRNEDGCPPAPQISGVAIGATDTVTGTTIPNARVEFFSDDEDEGRTYEGYVQANASGNFAFSKVGGFVGPNVTATSSDAAGNTSQFSEPSRLLWTLLLYLNGDNDLEDFMFDTLTNTAAAGPSLRANVLALVDGYTTTTAHSGTALYDLTRGEAMPIDVPWLSTGERNMGDGQTLTDFVTWGRDYRPARHTLLAIVDHGGGWAPSSSPPISSTMPIRQRSWMAGSSGLSWDFSSEYDYLDSQEIREAMAAMTGGGARPLDVLFYDVCLMGMVEVAYQIKDYASFFISAPNIGWAPLGPDGRYIQMVSGIGPGTTPRQMAELTVSAYANSMPPEGHPFAIMAIDLRSLAAVATAVEQLSLAISETLIDPGRAASLHAVYRDTQKLDYDSDFFLEPDTDGFVDLFDLAQHAAQQLDDPAVIAAAQALMAELESAVVAEMHQSGAPWPAPDRSWDLEKVRGPSVFLPLGEDLELPILITVTMPMTPGLAVTRNLRLRDVYSCEQLQFVCDTGWGELIDTYYEMALSPVPSDTITGPVSGLLAPDLTPPQTTITVTGTWAVGQVIRVVWSAADTQAGVSEAALWHRPPGGQWGQVGSPQPGSSGAVFYTLSKGCENGLAVRATDKVGNQEPVASGSNMVTVVVSPCIPVYLPVILRPPLMS